MNIQTILEEILTEIKLIKKQLEYQNKSQFVQKNEVFIPPKIMTLTIGTKKIEQGHYYLYTIDIPGKHDEPIKQGGYFKEEDEEIAEILAITSAIESTLFLKKPTHSAIVRIKNTRIAEYLNLAITQCTDNNEILEKNRRNEKLQHTANIAKQLSCKIETTTAQSDYRMSKIDEELDEIYKEFIRKQEKRDVNSNRNDLRSVNPRGEESK